MLEWIMTRIFRNRELDNDLKSLENARKFVASNPNLDTGTWSALKTIHFHLFKGIYDHAGKPRRVNFSKGGFHFLDFNDFQAVLPKVTGMPETSFEEIVDKYTEMNIVHPFREGNGRAMRIWLDDMLVNRLSLRVDWRLIDKNDYLECMVQSSYDNSSLKYLLSNSMTDKINDKTIIFEGLNKSYIYEMNLDNIKKYKKGKYYEQIQLG